MITPAHQKSLPFVAKILILLKAAKFLGATDETKLLLREKSKNSNLPIVRDKLEGGLFIEIKFQE